MHTFKGKEESIKQWTLHAFLCLIDYTSALLKVQPLSGYEFHLYYLNQWLHYLFTI